MCVYVFYLYFSLFILLFPFSFSMKERRRKKFLGLKDYDPLDRTHSLTSSSEHWNLYCFEKWRRTDDICKNNDHYMSCMWVGLVDQKVSRPERLWWCLITRDFRSSKLAKVFFLLHLFYYTMWKNTKAPWSRNLKCPNSVNNKIIVLLYKKMFHDILKTNL